MKQLFKNTPSEPVIMIAVFVLLTAISYIKA